MSTTKPDTETGWTKEYPSLAHGSWFWLRHAPDAKPELHQLTGGRSWMESFGIVRDTTEFLGPVSPDDLEQLIRLRRAAGDAEQVLTKVGRGVEGLEGAASRVAAQLREALAPKGEVS